MSLRDIIVAKRRWLALGHLRIIMALTQSVCEWLIYIAKEDILFMEACHGGSIESFN